MKCIEEYYPQCRRHWSHCRSSWRGAERSALTWGYSVSAETLSHVICWRSHNFLKQMTQKGKWWQMGPHYITAGSSRERLKLGYCSEMRTKIWVTSSKFQKKHGCRTVLFYQTHPQVEQFTCRCPYWHSCPPLSHITDTSGHKDTRSWVTNPGSGLMVRRWIRGFHWNWALQWSIKPWDIPATDNLDCCFTHTGLTAQCVPEGVA